MNKHWAGYADEVGIDPLINLIASFIPDLNSKDAILLWAYQKFGTVPKRGTYDLDDFAVTIEFLRNEVVGVSVYRQGVR